MAPVVGALVLQVADWRMTFWVLALIGSGCLVLVLLFEETLPACLLYTSREGRQADS